MNESLIDYGSLMDRASNITHGLNYIGHGDHFPETANEGDLYAIGETMYVMVGGEWMEIGEPSDTEPKELVSMICSRCGAPLHGNKCEYCDTEYR